MLFIILCRYSLAIFIRLGYGEFIKIVIIFICLYLMYYYNWYWLYLFVSIWELINTYYIFFIMLIN